MTTAPRSRPLAYFLTFHPYGTWLPGDERGWHHRGRSERLPPAPALAAHCAKHLRYPVVTLTPDWREIVRSAINETCSYRGGLVLALVVERTHVHIVVVAPVAPERVLRDLKAWATRRLRRHGHLLDHPHPWAEHGSTGYLFEERNVQAAIDYVLDDHHPDAQPQRAR